MPYLGNIPATQFAELKYQDFTGGTGTSFTLNDPVGSAQELEVFVNNVRQEPGVAYTVSGTALTMTGSIVATDDFYVVFQGKSTGTATHPAGQALTATDGTFTGNLDVSSGTIKLDGNYPTGTNNVALGNTALDDGSLSGSNNTAIGSAGLSATTSGSDNTATGFNTLATNTTGSGNTAIGKSALSLNATGNDNVAVGQQALEDSTASGNTAVGYAALLENTSGTGNTAVGKNALDANTTANNSTAVGSSALSASTGARNTAVGRDAGAAATTGTNSTFIGDSCGNAMTTGGKNTIIGRYSGNQDSLDVRTVSNQVILSDGDGKVVFRTSNTKCAVIPGFGSDNSGGVQGNASLNVYKDGSTLRVIHSQNKNNTSGDENYRSVLGSNCNNSSSYHFIATIDGGGDKLYMYGNGNIQNTNNSYGGLSDSKLKENISDAASQWDDIKAVQVKKYSWIADDLDAANQIGVIAQDLEASGMGGLVETNDDKDQDGALTGTQTKGVKYSVLYMKAVKALQEAMTRIETLETENATQATQIADLITRVTALEDA